MITACGTFTSPGAYILANDIAGPCLTFSGASGIQLDCQNHQVASLGLVNVTNVTVNNCVVSNAIGLNNVTNGTINKCTAGAVQVNGGSTILIAYSSLVGSGARVTNATAVQFFADTINDTFGEVLLMVGGRNNQVMQTTITGGYGGGAAQVGADDGIALEGETGDTIQGNTISNFFDAGIEAADALSGTTIANNTLTNLGTAGIASYWCTNWSGNTIRNNTVSLAPRLVQVQYQTGPASCTTPFAPAAFTSNQFIGNVFQSPIVGLGPSGPLSRMSVSMSVGPVSGNLMQGNNFGSNEGPELLPLNGFVDGGGNICASSTVSNFSCGGTSSTASTDHGLRSPTRPPLVSSRPTARR